jgi:myo-inositol-hexaphosphate 3-phosphohydrolase
LKIFAGAEEQAADEDDFCWKCVRALYDQCDSPAIVLHESKAAQASLVAQTFNAGMQRGDGDGDMFD